MRHNARGTAFEPMPMTIACPFCTTRYLLPDHLLGPGGARVRCPSCHRSFVVPADAARPEAHEPEVAPLSGAPARVHAGDAHGAAAASGGGEGARTEGTLPPIAPVPSRGHSVKSRGAETPAAGDAPAATDHAAIARAVLAALAEHHGAAIETAAASGRLFSEFGPDVFAAYDDYRRRVGKGASAEAFRAALRERWNVDLPSPGVGEERL